MRHFPYSVPERRSPTDEERKLVRLLVSRVAPARLQEVETLEVFARCGCGKCPTVMFHAEPEKKKEAERVIADFLGGDEVVGLIGIMLWERDGELSELEAWSIDGKDVVAWPALDTIRPFEVSDTE